MNKQQRIQEIIEKYDEAIKQAMAKLDKDLVAHLRASMQAEIDGLERDEADKRAFQRKHWEL